MGSDGVAFGYLRGHVGGKIGTADAVRKQAPPATVTSSTNTTGRRPGPTSADQNQLRPELGYRVSCTQPPSDPSGAAKSPYYDSAQSRGVGSAVIAPHRYRRALCRRT